MRRGAFLILVIALAIAVPVRGSAKQEKRKPIEALAWLVRGVWTADASKLGGGIQRAEMRFTWSDNDEYIRFNMHFVGAKTLYIYDGSFFWNPEKGTLAMWNMNGKNEILQGPVKIDGNTVTATFQAKDSQEKEAEFQMVIIRKTNDDYGWLMQEEQAGGWRRLLELAYSRRLNS